MKRSAFLRVALAVVALVALIAALNPDLGVLQSTTSVAAEGPARRGPSGTSRTAAGGELRSLDGAVEWINSPPLTASALRGKVVLIEFWTYTCINWMRSQPYVRAWAERYAAQGLVVIGVHTPEFGFEKQSENVRRGAKELRVDYPIVIDNDYAIWRAFRNAAWPALYLVDAQGRIRYSHLGEGEYERSERMIQQLLSEAANSTVAGALTAVEGSGVEAAADWQSLRSPETYTGYERTARFSSAGGPALNKRHVYAGPSVLKLNQWALAGNWTMGKESTVLNQPKGRVIYRFHARDVHLVMGSSQAGTSVRFRVLVDGQAPAAVHGLDIDAQGYGAATTQRLYQLIRQSGRISERLFEIEFLDAGVEIFAFTFG